MSYLAITAGLVLPPILGGVATWLWVGAMNEGAPDQDAWLALYMAMDVAALTWLGSLTWIRVKLKKGN